MNMDGKEIHKRRPRYKGTHPRHFHEKYKEQNPEKYKDTIEKVIRKGYSLNLYREKIRWRRSRSPSRFQIRILNRYC